MRLLVALVLLFAAAAAAAAAAAGPSFTFVAAEQGRLADLGQLSVFHTLVTNTGDVADTYTVVITKAMPAGWTASLCEGSVCYAPFIEQITFSLAPGAETNLDVDMTPVSSVGGGDVSVRVTSGVSPGLTATNGFTVITPGLDVLLVDGDGGASLETYYAAALGASSRTYARWPRGAAGALAGTDLGGFDHVVWFNGPAGPGLDDADRAALAYYVQHGGALLLSGQDLAWQACDPASPAYSAGATAWFDIVLGTGYASGGIAEATAVGAAGDPATAGLVLDLQGGDGAGGNTSCDRLTATSGSITLLYGGGGAAAVRGAYGQGKTFFCAFGLESVASAAQRSALMEAFFASLNAPTPVPDAAVAALADFQAAPNPFNPRTEIRFTVGEAAAGPVTVEVVDLRGAVVRRLWAGAMAAGPARVAWDGRDDGGRPAGAGLYLVRIAAQGAVLGGKLVLAK
ncbi:MAG TPA: FlgD immunoglobulin-like domain containing protein [Candidatus Krumholzibacteria bacterium]|nr:FlgD immunoglobulin-like domain containing protein [Candidatus Krumholzibacteria bacterium]